jgi:YegS/Rv2252/BmrU family lipid kinase
MPEPTADTLTADTPRPRVAAAPWPPPALPGTRLLVYNPGAGSRIRLDRLTEICRLFGERGWPVIPHPTRGPRTAANVVREFSADIDGVVVLGGDGTLNEVLPAVVDTPLFVAIMPGGTANVLAHELQLPLRLNRAVDSLTGGHVRAVNVGRANDRYFLAMAGAGFDARIVEAMSARLKGRLGRLAFVLEAVRQLRRYDFAPIRFQSDEGEWDAPFGVVSNTRCYGGGYVMAPDAALDEPLLDLCLFRSRGVRAYLRYLYHLACRSHTRLPDVVYRKVRRVALTSSIPAPFQLDGEAAGNLPVAVECVPNALRLVFPRPPGGS